MRYAAFLRAINVGGRNVPMARLKVVFESAGFTSVRTVIASGNVVFDAKSTDPGEVEAAIEHALEEGLGWGADTFVRTREELESLTQSPPFNQAEIAAAGACIVAFLHATPEGPALERLMAFSSETDRLESRGREVFWLCGVKQSQSEFSNAVLEKALGTRATMRGLATVQRVLEAMASFGPHSNQV